MPITLYIYGLPGVGKKSIDKLLSSDEVTSEDESEFEAIGEFICHIVHPGKLKETIKKSNVELKPCLETKQVGGDEDIENQIEDASHVTINMDDYLSPAPSSSRPLPAESPPSNITACILVVIKKDRITDDIHKITAEEIKIITSPKNPVILLITGCDFDTNQHWWDENQDEFKKYGLSFSTVIPGCAADPDTQTNEFRAHFCQRRKQTKDALVTAIHTIAEVLDAGIYEDDPTIMTRLKEFLNTVLDKLQQMVLWVFGSETNTSINQSSNDEASNATPETIKESQMADASGKV